MKIPLTLRLAFHGIRATVRAGVLLVIAWVFLIPATAEDAAALGATNGAKYPGGLRMMRAAKVIVAIAPTETYGLMAMALQRDVSPIMLQILITQISLGNVPPMLTEGNDKPYISSDRDIDGPRFIKID